MRPADERYPKLENMKIDFYKCPKINYETSIYLSNFFSPNTDSSLEQEKGALGF